MASTTQDRPPRGRGHYSDDGSQWWDDDQARWFPTTGDVDTLEIDVEDYGHSSMLRSITTTLTGQHGTQSYRFVARVRGADPRWPTFTIPSGTFPVGPLQLPIESVGPDEAWGDQMRARLAELDQALRAEGWQPAGRASTGGPRATPAPRSTTTPLPPADIRAPRHLRQHSIGGPGNYT